MNVSGPYRNSAWSRGIDKVGNMLFLRFLDIDMSDEVWDHSSFSKYLSQVTSHEVGELLFAEMVSLAKESDLFSNCQKCA